MYRTLFTARSPHAICSIGRKGALWIPREIDACATDLGVELAVASQVFSTEHV